MARHSTPTPPGGLVADAPGRVGSAARGWPGLGWLLADRWGEEGHAEVARLWAAARDAEDLPLVLRARAATCADPFLRW